MSKNNHSVTRFAFNFRLIRAALPPKYTRACLVLISLLRRYYDVERGGGIFCSQLAYLSKQDVLLTEI